MNNAVILRLLEYEQNTPDKGDYLNFKATVSSQGFCGDTEFWVSRNDFERFLDDLAEFDSKLNGDAVLVCGWDQTILFKLRFLAYDALGHIGVQVEISRPAREDHLHKVETDMQIEPSGIAPFLSNLRTVVNKREKTEVVMQAFLK